MSLTEIQLVEYDPLWPTVFEHERIRLSKALGSVALTIEHVGSTSVPGLVAKPIIDILLLVADSADETAYVPKLEAINYVMKVREPDWHQHRMLKGPGQKVNLHVFSDRCPEIDRMLLFRDWLRRNSEDRRLYEQTKRQLAKQKWDTVQDYADAKSSVVEEILKRARSNSD